MEAPEALAHGPLGHCTRGEGCLISRAMRVVALSPAAMASAARTKKPKQIDDLLGLGSGRRDWTRTNDPHHVKVVL